MDFTQGTDQVIPQLLRGTWGNSILTSQAFDVICFARAFLAFIFETHPTHPLLAIPNFHLDCLF